MRIFKIVLFSVLLLLSLVMLLGMYGVLHGFFDKIDPQYAVEVFEGDVETREFTFDDFDALVFFDDTDPLTDFSKRTKLLNATPRLKILNSEEYRVEIKANADVFDKLKLGVTENPDGAEGRFLTVTFADDCYVPVHVDDVEYDYDTGLYVDFDTFEVTVYAPVTRLYTDCALVLDYEAPKCEEVRLVLSDVQASVHGIDAEKLILNCNGTSKVKLSGAVRGKSCINIWHNTKVDASELAVGQTDDYVSSSLYGRLSYIKYSGGYDFGVGDEGFGSMLTYAVVLHLLPLAFGQSLFRNIRKKKA